MSNEWKIVRLGDVCDISAGGTPSRSKREYWHEGTIPWVKIGDMNEKYLCKTTEYITELGLNSSSAKLFEKGTILFSIFASLGVVSILDIDATTNQAIAGLRIKDSRRLDKGFLYHFLVSIKKEIERIGRGVAQNNINLGVLKGYSITLPSFAKQREIAAVLDKASELVALRKRQLAELDTLVESVFYDMFGDPVTNPKGWDKKVWKELFDTRLGKMLDKRKQIATDILLPYLGNSNVLWDRFVLNNLSLMTFSEKEIDILKLHRGDLLICEGGEAGRCAVWNEDGSNILFQKAIHRARIKDADQINVTYVQRLILELKDKGALNKYISKATIEHLTGEKIKTIIIPVPPLVLQEEFATIIEKIEEQKAKVKEALKESEDLFQRLMQDMFNPEYHKS